MRSLLRTQATALLGLLSGCGAGVAGVVASSGSAGGSSTPVLDSFVVGDPKVSPVELRLDASQAVRVGLFYDLGAGPEPMTEIMGITGNEVDLPAGGASFEWDFASELGRTSFTPDVKLIAKRGGAVMGGGELTLAPGLGNDAPIVHDVKAMPTDPQNPEESAGNVELRLRISDTSSDPVDVTLEWRRESEPPERWTLATAAGVFPGGVETAKDPGVELSFFWNTNVDLAEQDDAVFFRVTADDRTEPSEPFVTAALFRVDNNEEPTVTIDSGFFVANTDQRRGIPIPYRLSDGEGDLVTLVFQWRLLGTAFPALPENADDVRAILLDPARRAEFHVCSEFPTYARGRLSPVDPTHVRLPELAGGEAWILARGLAGRELEVLRASSIPEPRASAWDENHLEGPVAALPLGDGLTALVVDSPDGRGRIQEVELSSGRIVREVALLDPGLPSSATLEPGNEAVLVASEDAGLWRIERVEIATGAVTPLLVAENGDELGPIRAIASLGTRAALFTVGSSIVHLAYGDPSAVRSGVVLTGLAAPWGIALDPRKPNQILVAESEATELGGRILQFRLDTRDVRPVALETSDLGTKGLGHLQALALEEGRLLVLTRNRGVHRLLGLDLWNRSREVFPIGPPLVEFAPSIGIGPEHLRILPLPVSNDLAIAGGLVQARSIASYTAAGTLVELASPLDPLAKNDLAWRIRASGPLLARREGSTGQFVWDSADVAPGQTYDFMVTALDQELGSRDETSGLKTVSAEFSFPTPTISGPGDHVVVRDFDGDGDQDLISSDKQTSTFALWIQRSAASIDPMSIALDGSGSAVPDPLEADDLDRDGDFDVVSGNTVSNNLGVFFQSAPGVFDPADLLGGASLTEDPKAVLAVDLDSDGLMEVVSANRGNDDLKFFSQSSPGVFDPVPTRIDSVVNPAHLAAGDLDADGDLDLVAITNHVIRGFFQEQTGRFSSAGLNAGTRILLGKAVHAVDLDGDGDLDLAAVDYDASSVLLFLQTDERTFELGSELSDGFAQSVASADVDRDGDVDLVSSRLWLQRSPGAFALSSSGSFGATSVTPVDFDGDGDIDVASADQTFKVGLQSRAPLLSPPVTTGGGLSALDLDSDGDLDLLRPGAKVLFQIAPAVFDPFELDLPATGSAVAGADLDSDGDVDVLCDNSVFTQQGPAIFAPAIPLVNPGLLPSSVAIADMDSDSDLDIVLANDALRIFAQRDGGFTDAPFTLGSGATPVDPLGVAPADLDQDGDVDLVSGNGSSLTAFFQRLPGRFDPEPLVLTTSSSSIGISAVTTSDLDGDGDLDVAFINSNSVFIFFHAERGRFDPVSLLVDSVTPSVTTGDADGDGDFDLATNALFLQGRPGRFSLLGGVIDAIHAILDIDGDGDADILGSSSITWGQR